jgi:hypothetical protein
MLPPTFLLRKSYEAGARFRMPVTEQGTLCKDQRALCKDKVAVKYFYPKCNSGMTAVILFNIETGFLDFER